MKILFLSDDFPPQSFGGAGISTYELAVGMKDAGHKVFVITTCRKKSDAGELDYHGIKIFRIASDYPDKWRAYRSLYNQPVVCEVEELLKKCIKVCSKPKRFKSKCALNQSNEQGLPECARS